MNEAVIKHYASYHKGMIVGLSFLYKLKLIGGKPDSTEIYSTLTVSNKKIGSCSVKVFYSIFTPVTRVFFESLDLIFHFNSVDIDEGMNFVIALDKRLQTYDDFHLRFLDMRDKEKYPRYIYLELAKRLDKLHISNRVMEWYEAEDSSSFEKD